MPPRAAIASLLLIPVAPVSLAGCVTPIAERPWAVVSSPHFETYSTMAPDEVVALANRLEQFRALVYLVTNAHELESPVPTRITAFGRRSEIGRVLGHSLGFVGLFSSSVRRNEVLILDSRGKDLGETLLHEYVHFLLRNASSRHYPLWYDEDFAEFLSTARPFEDMMGVGAVPESRVEVLKLL